MHLDLIIARVSNEIQDGYKTTTCSFISSMKPLLSHTYECTILIRMTIRFIKPYLPQFIIETSTIEQYDMDTSASSTFRNRIWHTCNMHGSTRKHSTGTTLRPSQTPSRLSYHVDCSDQPNLLDTLWVCGVCATDSIGTSVLCHHGHCALCIHLANISWDG
ncbi:hypothetical protein QVD99_004951 [Batrachochytrium dendrobatidis]|nr:hypothetical protein O5D80_004608 [Batrachochytrium dendrobatidis]KAK5667899.1 hypothetical protein QVD99_004951 [Batrachochytrium dendrobatidis]